MLHHQEGPNGVYAEGMQDFRFVELGGGLFGVEDAGEDEGEVEVG